MFRQSPAGKEDMSDMASCPFNPAHTFARNRLLFHLNTCKDKKKKEHLFSICQYNPLHFHPKDEIELHQLVCSDRADYQQLRRTLALAQQQARRNRDRSRSREKETKKESFYKKECKLSSGSESESEEEEEEGLEDCEECQAILKTINLDDHPKLVKLIKRYEQESKLLLQLKSQTSK